MPADLYSVYTSTVHYETGSKSADPGDIFVMLPRVKAIVISILPVGKTETW
jgi:hypothetical protein